MGKNFSKGSCFLVLAFFTWGEGLHNNHHNNPKNPIFRKKWFEIDLSEPFIRLIKI